MQKKILIIFIFIFIFCACFCFVKLHNAQSVVSGFICGANPGRSPEPAEGPESEVLSLPKGHLSMASQLWLSGAWADNTQTQSDSFLSGSNRPPSGFDPMSRVPITIISLILVGALAYLVLTFMGSKSWLPKISAKNIKIIERQYLGPKHSIFIIKVFNEYLLLGAAEGAINTLKELNKEEVEKFLGKNVEVDKTSSKNYWSKFFSTKMPFKKQ